MLQLLSPHRTVLHFPLFNVYISLLERKVFEEGYSHWAYFTGIK